MKLLESYNYYEGYKLNIEKTKILSISHSPTQAIQQAFALRWNAKKKEEKYRRLTITNKLPKLYEANHYMKQIHQEIQKIWKDGQHLHWLLAEEY